MAQTNNILFTRYYANGRTDAMEVTFSKYPKNSLVSAIAEAMLDEGGKNVTARYRCGTHILTVERENRL